MSDDYIKSTMPFGDLMTGKRKVLILNILLHNYYKSSPDIYQLQ